MRDLGAESISVYGVSVSFTSGDEGRRYAPLMMRDVGDSRLRLDPDPPEDNDDEVDGIPMAADAAWLAQKAKQDEKRKADSAPQVDLQQWYTARPLPSVD